MDELIDVTRRPTIETVLQLFAEQVAGPRTPGKRRPELEAPTEETRIAAVRGLGRTGLLEAAIPILDHLLESLLNIPEHAVKNALASCCRGKPLVLLRYLNRSNGASRELLARVLGELATSDLGEDLGRHLITNQFFQIDHRSSVLADLVSWVTAQPDPLGHAWPFHNFRPIKRKWSDWPMPSGF